MIHRGIFIGSLLLIMNGLSAQFLQIGLQGGINSSSLRVNEIVDLSAGSKYRMETFNPSLGFQGGLFARVKLWKIFLQPALQFSSTGGQVKVSDLINNTSVIRNQTFNMVNIPVLAGIKSGPLRIQAGPVASFLLSEKSDLLAVADYSADFRKATVGYQAGIGFDILKKITLDFCYEGSLSKLGDGIKVGSTTYPFDSRTSQWIVNLGILF